MSAPQTFKIYHEETVLLPANGERQVAKRIQDIAPDHVERYRFAADWLRGQIGKGSVLDIACGCGYGSYILAEAGFNVTAVDISPEAIAYGAKYWNHKNITFRQGSAEDEIQGQFDAIVSFETLEHVDASVALWWFCLASPIIICSVPNQDVQPYTSQRFPFHLRHYTPSEFEHLLCEYNIVHRCTQHSKRPGLIEDGFDGRNLIAVGVR